MTAYYNENDSFAAHWLRNLIDEGHIAPGDVDDRSITEVQASDLEGYTQCHFFAGIAGWSLALRLAGWPDDRPVWTASCPCQPFSSAGKRAGVNDDRHLWPVLSELVRERRPSTVIGEQVSSPDGLAWFDAVHADLEVADYACGALDLCAAGVGAPHKRQRLYWVGYANGGDRQQGRAVCVPERGQEQEGALPDGAGGHGGLGDPSREHLRREPQAGTGAPRGNQGEGHQRQWRGADDCGAGADGSPWGDPAWVLCDDPSGPRWRPIEPGAFPLAPRLPNRVGRLRAYGNAIVPALAAEFIGAVMDTIDLKGRGNALGER